MASRTIHLAAAKLIAENSGIADSDSFYLGSILPDAKLDSALRKAPHFQIFLPDGRICYDLGEFLRLYRCRLHEPLYLGYYLHLVQDAEYRRFMYIEHGWNSLIPGNVEKIHSDYRRINRPVIEAFGLERVLRVPEYVRSEDIVRRFDFDIDIFLQALEGDFVPVAGGGNFNFFTPDMALEFIERAAKVCLLEMEAIAADRPLYDHLALAWGAGHGC